VSCPVTRSSSRPPLQAAQAGDAPIVIRIDTDAGHGSGKPVGKLMDERADVLAFLELALGVGSPGPGEPRKPAQPPYPAP
jgi:hypothetical protein